MGKEYIEREAANKLLKDACDECRDACEEFDGIYADCNQCIMHGVVKGLPGIPAADVVPVVHGHWIKSPECPEEYDICSVCGKNDKHRSRGNCEHDMVESVPPFCKWCGARMDLVTDRNQVKDGDEE